MAVLRAGGVRLKTAAVPGVGLDIELDKDEAGVLALGAVGALAVWRGAIVASGRSLAGRARVGEEAERVLRRLPSSDESTGVPP